MIDLRRVIFKEGDKIIGELRFESTEMEEEAVVQLTKVMKPASSGTQEREVANSTSISLDL